MGFPPPVVGYKLTEVLVLLGIVLTATSGVPGLFLNRDSMSGQWFSALLASIGSGLGLAGTGSFWSTGESEPILRPWLLPDVEFHVAVDGLSAVFLTPIFLISLLGHVYGLQYWKQTEHRTGAKLRFFYGTLTAGMVLLVIARNSILFLFGWEVMALSAFFLVTTEAQDREVRDAGWLYLVATHFATLCLFALFAVLRTASGSFAMAPVGNLPPGWNTAIFILAMAGFGLKAGVMPLHVWLPSAHAMAPSHVSAIMSGVLIKMGIYGLMRVTSLVPHPPMEWGAIVLTFGVVSGVLGVAFALGQHDLKRLLAYHSIENIGIIVMGLGLALVGRSRGHAEWVILGIGSALLHVWNHALFKALLFLSAGSVIHAAHTREIDRLGGLSKSMPRTAGLFMIGAVAICGLPPLNGFVSEFLLYLGLFETLGMAGGPPFAAAVFAAPALALMGALALACFVKVYGAVFLGNPRSNAAENATEAPMTMLLPMNILACCCFLIGLVPLLIVPVLAKGIEVWAPEIHNAGPRLLDLAPFDRISKANIALLAILLLAGAALGWYLQRSTVTYGVTWGCGYAAPSPRMQYTSSSFAQMLVGLFRWVLQPRTHRTKRLPRFPPPADFHSEVPDTVLDRAMIPAFHFGSWFLSRFRVFQQGNIQVYLLYIFVALICLLLWQ